ncbi:VOC family protein [Salinirubellus sp. GCM10025899]|uniref:VOC family protein n=1 Tax=Salinirubellus sp. GCM10025899 TaxID=3252689 RepID=UPI00362412FF
MDWFEIPVEDVDRAREFYATVLGCEFAVDEDAGGSYPMFTAEDGDVTGALTPVGEHPVGEEGTRVAYTTGDSGPLVYLAVEDLQSALAAVEPAGGEVRAGPQETADGASYGILTDPAGNRIGLMSRGSGSNTS